MFDARLQAAHSLANSQSYLANQLRAAASSANWPAFSRVAEELLRRRPDDVATMSSLASVYREQGRLAEAEKLAEHAVALKPESASLHCVRAEIALERRDFATVRKTLDTALRLDPRHPRAWELRGRALFVQDLPEEAIDAMRQAIAADETATTPRLLLAEMLRRSGKTIEAADVLRHLLEVDPNHAQARRMLKTIQAEPGR
jgi:cytochrome c-type biogenesis protein CcmH/NrfG